MNTANVLTLTRILLVPIFILFFYVDIPYHMVFALGIFILASITDWLDGMIARKYAMITDFGRFMDPIADKLLVLAGVLMLVATGIIHPVIAFILVGREMIMSGFRLVAATKGLVISAGILGKIKTITQFVAIGALLISGYIPRFAQYCAIVLLYISVFFSVWSCVDYIIRNRSVLNLKNI